MSVIDTIAAAPFLILVLFTLCMLMLDLFGGSRLRLGWMLGGCFFAWCALLLQLGVHSGPALQGLSRVDPLGVVLGTLILGGTALTFLLNHRQLEAQRAFAGADVDVLIISAACGALVMVSSMNLMVFFLGFELLSVCVYVLTGIARGEQASSEGALKYFVLGAFSSAFLLYGITLIYGATGSMDLASIAQVQTVTPMFVVGLALIIFGFAFKIGAVPFHFWTPDVYQGAPVSITAFMAVVVKVAAFGSFLRVMYVAFGDLSDYWAGVIWTISVLTMTIGNLVALRQRSVKRMLAYSSISHAGYALIGFLVLGEPGGAEATLFYLVAYSVMTIAAFGVVLVATAGGPAQYENDEIDSLAGLGWSHPFLGIVMSIAMLSLAGMPPFVGFVGKFYLFSAAVRGGYTGLAIIAALNSVVSLYYYLGIIVALYFRGDRKLPWSPAPEIAFGPRFALILSGFGTVYLGIFSSGCFEYVRLAIREMGTGL